MQVVSWFDLLNGSVKKILLESQTNVWIISRKDVRLSHAITLMAQWGSISRCSLETVSKQYMSWHWTSRKVHWIFGDVLGRRSKTVISRSSSLKPSAQLLCFLFCFVLFCLLLGGYFTLFCIRCKPMYTTKTFTTQLKKRTEGLFRINPLILNIPCHTTAYQNSKLHALQSNLTK